MGCAACGSGGCGTSNKNGSPGGCRSNGGCMTGGCNRLNVYNWLSDLPYSAEQDNFKIVEVSFKNGSRKAFYKKRQQPGYSYRRHSGSRGHWWRIQHWADKP